MPSVLVANPFYPPFVPGGAEHSLVEFCRHMASVGWKIHVLTEAWDGTPRVEEQMGCTVEWIPGPVVIREAGDQRAETYLASTAGSRALVSAIRRHVRQRGAPDWILANNTQYLEGVAMAAFELNLPASVILRDTQLMCETAACLDGRPAVSAHACQGRTGAAACYARFVRARRSLAWRAWPGVLLDGWRVGARRRRNQLLARRLKRIVTISEALAHLARRIPGIAADHVDVIPNFATGEAAAAPEETLAYLSALGLAPRTFFLMAGRKSFGKGADVGAAAAAGLSAGGGTFKLLMVGEGSAPTGANGAGLVHAPAIPRALLMAVLELSLGLVVPGRRQEGLHRTMLDALARGIPVICTDAGGVAEGVSDGRTGYVVRCNDAGAICDAMIRVANWSAADQERCRQVSAEIKAAHFSSAVLTRKWNDFDARMRSA